MARKPRAKKGAEAPVQEQITESAGRPELTGQKSGDGLPEVSVGEALASASSKVMPQSSASLGCDGPADDKPTIEPAVQSNPTTTRKPMTTESKKSPVEKFNDGPVQVALWENDSVSGKFRTATFQLRKKINDQWQTVDSYGATDLLHDIAARTEARARIMAWNRTQDSRKDNG